MLQKKQKCAEFKHLQRLPRQPAPTSNVFGILLEDELFREESNKQKKTIYLMR